MPATIVTALRLVWTIAGMFTALFALCFKGQGHRPVQRQSSGYAFELRDEHQAEADVVVAITGIVVVAISRAAVPRIVVPASAAKNTIRTHGRCPLPTCSRYDSCPAIHALAQFPAVGMGGKCLQWHDVTGIHFLIPLAAHQLFGIDSRLFNETLPAAL
jgi:hypothetical protein